MGVTKDLSTLLLNQERFILQELLAYASDDSKFLSIPQTTNIADPFMLAMIKNNTNPQKNHFLVGLNLMHYLQTVNRKLSILFAAHQYLIARKDNHPTSSVSQSEVDLEVFKDDAIIQEYIYSLRAFILMLRTAVDQLIILLTHNGETSECDKIGSFLSKLKSTHITNNHEYDKKFLVGLNSAANYLKHNADQFENPAITFPLKTPALLILVNKNDKESKTDFEGLNKYFSAELLEQSNNNHITCWISCEFLVTGFNTFYEQACKNIGAFKK